MKAIFIARILLRKIAGLIVFWSLVIGFWHQVVLANNPRNLVVIAANNDFQETFNMARLYRNAYKNNPEVEIVVVNISNNFSYTQFSGRRIGNENIFGQPRTHAYEQVFYIIDSHGVSTPNGLVLNLSESENATVDLGVDSPFLRQLVEHTPNARSRDLALLSCNAGSFDANLFPGNVFGASPSDGFSRLSDQRAFNSMLEDQILPSLTATEFYNAWTTSVVDMSNLKGELGYAPPWLVTLSSTGKRRTRGTRTMGNQRSPVFDSHRQYVFDLNIRGTKHRTKCTSFFETISTSMH